jgi:hypothetical protein
LKRPLVQRITQVHTKLLRCFRLFDFPVRQDLLNHFLITSPTPIKSAKHFPNGAQKEHVKRWRGRRIEFVFEL